MTLTRTDLKEAALLLKAGKIDIVREILSGSDDPRAVAALAKLNARFAPEIKDELAEIKQLIRQKRFAEAEAMLRASSHPKARHLLEKLATKTASETLPTKPEEQPRKRSALTAMVARASGVLLRRRS
jgi:hypothetical protein